MVLAFIVALPACWFLGALIANPLLEPGFEAVDLGDPPVDLAWLVSWTGEDGQAHCRPFYRRDLVRHEDSLPELRFGQSDSDMAVCRVSLEAFRRDGQWPDRFSWDARIFAADASRLGEGAPQLFEVLYMSDVDRLAVTRYQVDPATGQPAAVEFRGSFGPAQGIGLLLFGGGGGTIAWLTLVTWYAMRRRRHRLIRSAAGTAAS